jgi:DNA polymerase-3 subunit delta
MIVTLTGENDALRQQELGRIVEAFVAEYGDMALERLDGEEAEYERMHEAAQGAPFLSNRKVVVLRKPSANKEFIEKFETLLADVAETNDMVLVEPKLDKRLAYYKQLRKLTEFKEFPVLDANGLVRFAVEYAKAQTGSLGTADARLLIDRLGLNQLALQHELDKLLAYDPHITRASIEALTERTPQSSIFELLDAAFTGNTSRAMALYAEQRAQRVEPQQIIAMLVWQLHILAIVKTAGQRSSADIAREARLSPFVVQKTQNLARTITLQRLKALISSLRDFDTRLKSESLNADESVRYYLVALGS